MANSEVIVLVVDNETFGKRVEYFVIKAALAVMTESEATANHSDRIVYAQRVLNANYNKHGYVVGVLTNSTIAALSDPSAVNDNDLEFVVNSLFDAFAG